MSQERLCIFPPPGGYASAYVHPGIRRICSVFLLVQSLHSASTAQSSGRYTALSGFYDHQTNNTCQYVRVNPRTPGRVHVIFQTAFDSTDFLASRRTVYAYSTNEGLSWNNFNNLTIPAGHSGFPTLDLLQGSNCPGAPVVANHTSQGIRAYVDCPEGSGVFTELPSPASLGTDTLLYAALAGAADGSVVLAGSNATLCSTYVWRIDLINWFAGPRVEGGCGGYYALDADALGHVVLVVKNTQPLSQRRGLLILESTDNGMTWPSQPTLIVPEPVVIGPDTFEMWGSVDVVYAGGMANVVFALRKVNAIGNDGACIGFWNPLRGLRLAVPRRSVPGLVDSLNRPQLRHLSMGFPTIGVANLSNRLVIGFQAFGADTSARGYNFSDVFVTHARYDDSSWSTPINITFTPLLDERYPSVAKAAPPVVGGLLACIVWQEDTEPGSFVLGDDVPVTRTRQVFHYPILSEVEADPKASESFRLEQNYPNPFNASTMIGFKVQGPGFVSLKVFDVLGREVATLVDEVQEAGFKSVTFDAGNLSSGVYFYQLKAGGVVATRKAVLLR